MVSLTFPHSTFPHARRFALPIALAWCAAISACGGASASEHANQLGPCIVGDLTAGATRAGTLDVGSCPTHDGRRYADYGLLLSAGQSYLIVVTDRRDTTRRHPAHRRFDAALYSGDRTPSRLLDASTYQGRDPQHTISQLFFVAPRTAQYMLRVHGHEAQDRGAYSVVARPCGGGTLTVGVTSQGTLTPASCLEQMSFGADSGYADLWTVRLAPRQNVTIRVTSQNGVPLYIRAFGPELTTTESDGDVDRLEFTAREGGRYSVLVGQTAFDRRSYPYTIRISERRY
jgi:hypothetical protein